MRDRIYDVESSRKTFIGNFNQIKGAYINQRNLFVALLGLALSLVGLSISIVQSYNSQPQGKSTQIETRELAPVDTQSALSYPYEELISPERMIDSISRGDTTFLTEPQKNEK